MIKPYFKAIHRVKGRPPAVSGAGKTPHTENSHGISDNAVCSRGRGEPAAAAGRTARHVWFPRTQISAGDLDPKVTHGEESPKGRAVGGTARKGSRRVEGSDQALGVP